MEFNLKNKDGNALLELALNHGDKLKINALSLVSMSNTISLMQCFEGNFLHNIAKMRQGDQLFYQYIVASRGDGFCLLSNNKPGAIAALELDGSFYLNIVKDCFLAAEADVSLEKTQRTVTKNKASLKVLRASGVGMLFLGNYGGYKAIRLKRNEEIIVENSYVMAWTDGIRAKTELAGEGWLNTLTGAKVVVTRFSGPGTLLIHTKSNQGFNYWQKECGGITEQEVRLYINERLKDFKSDIKAEIASQIKSTVKVTEGDLSTPVEDDPIQKELKALTEQQRTSLIAKVQAMKTMTALQQNKEFQSLLARGYSVELISYLQENNK